MGGALGVTRGSSARGQGRRCLSGGRVAFQWATGLDMARRGLETGGAFVEMAVDVDMAKFPALETGLVVVGMVMSEGYVMVAVSPPDLGTSEGDFFFFGWGG